MEEAEARRAVRKALSEARAIRFFFFLSSSSVRGCQKSEQTLAFAKLTDTLGECLEKMKEKDVLSLPILDLEKKTTKDSFHGFVSVESCLRVFLENMAVFLVGRKQEPFVSPARKFKRESESYASDD